MKLKNLFQNLTYILMRVWKVSFEFQFIIEMTIEKIVNFQFCPNIEF